MPNARVHCLFQLHPSGTWDLEESGEILRENDIYWLLDEVKSTRGAGPSL